MFGQVDIDAYGMLHLQGPDPYVPEAGMEVCICVFRVKSRVS